MKQTRLTKVFAIAITAALATAIVIPMTTMKSQAAELPRVTVAAEVNDTDRNYLADLYDNASALLSIYRDVLPNDVMVSLDTARNQAAPVIANKGSADEVVQCISNLRIALCVAQASLNGTTPDTLSAPANVIGTAAYNREGHNLVSDRIANQVATIYQTTRNLPVTMVRTQILNDFVDRLYINILGRTADQAGRDAYVAALTNGTMTANDVVFSILNTNEFTSKNYSNQQYATILYRAFFDREPDAQGLANWTNALNNGTSRQDVASAFSNAAGWTNICEFYGL